MTWTSWKIKITFEYPGSWFSESKCTNPGPCRGLSAWDCDTVLRHFEGAGQLLHLLCGFELWFGEMHFGSSECFSNVPVKASGFSSHRLIFKGKHFHSTQIPHHIIFVWFCTARAHSFHCVMEWRCSTPPLQKKRDTQTEPLWLKRMYVITR